MIPTMLQKQAYYYKVNTSKALTNIANTQVLPFKTQ